MDDIKTLKEELELSKKEIALLNKKNKQLKRKNLFLSAFMVATGFILLYNTFG